MATLKDTIEKLAKAAGLDPQTNESLKNALSHEALSAIELDTAIHNLLLNNLMNEEAARNNPKLLNHFKGTLLKGIDAKLIDTLKDLDFPEEVISEIETVERTTAKIDALKSKIRETYEKKGSSKKTQEEFEKERKVLNDKIAELTAQLPEIEKREKGKYSSLLKERDLNAMLYSYEYAVDLPKEVVAETAKTLLSKKLAENKWNLEYSLENNTNPFRLVNESNLEVYKDNQPVSLKAFVDEVLSANKLLKVSGTPAVTTTATPKPQTNFQTISASNQPDLSQINAEYQQQLAQLSK